MEPILDSLRDTSKPAHLWFDEQVQYRLKIRSFSKAPPEVTVQKISFEAEYDRYRNAYENGFSRCGSKGGKRTNPGEARDPESIERSARRAKTNLRLRVVELAPSNFCTFTTREVGPDYLDADDWRSIWAHFVRLIRATSGAEFEYVAVLERHPSNPEHLHLHCAFRGRWHYNLLRRLWHIAIGHHRGVSIKKMMRGSDAPGGIQDRPVKAARGSFKQVRKVAKYLSKYITKDAVTQFNRKTYMSSKGVNVIDAKVYWLDSLDHADAIREAFMMIGQWDEELGITQQIFMPSDRVCWCAIDPEKSPPPPF